MKNKVDEQTLLVFLLNTSGALTVSYNYPNVIKSKACYFAKKHKESISKDMNLKESLIYGDLSYSPLEQLSALLDEVISLEKIFIQIECFKLLKILFLYS